MSWRRLENVFSRLLRQALKISWTSLQRNNFLFSKTFSRRLVHTSSGRLGRCTQDVFKTCLIVTLKTSSRHLQDMCWNVFQKSWWQTKCLLGTNLYLFLSNLYLYLANLYLANLYLRNLRLIQDKFKIHYLDPNNFDIHRIWNSNSTFRNLLMEKQVNCYSIPKMYKRPLKK